MRASKATDRGADRGAAGSRAGGTADPDNRYHSDAKSRLSGPVQAMR